MSTVAPTSGWSNTVTLAINPSGYIYTATPGTGGSILLQWSADNIEWVNFTDEPVSIAMSGGVPAGANYLRGMGFGAAGTFDVTEGPAATQLTPAQVAALTPLFALRYTSVTTYGVVPDGIGLYDFATTAGTASAIACSSASANFAMTDIGKVCSLVSNSANAATRAYGTIVDVTDATHCTCAFNSNPGTLANATFVYGSDNTSAMNAAFSDATVSSFALPWNSIICCTGKVTIPDGKTVSGFGRTVTGNFARNFQHQGSSIVLVANLNDRFLQIGDSSSSGIMASTLTDCNVDGMLNCTSAIYGGSTAATTERVTGIRGGSSGSNVYTFEFSLGGGKMRDCIAIGQQVGNVVLLSGDSKCIDNQIFGSGNGYYGIKASNADDCLIMGNHIWKDADTATALGGSVNVEFYGNVSNKGGVNVVNNKFDTAFGPHVLISTLPGTSGTTAGRGVNVIGNLSMQNDNVPANTYPWLSFSIPTGESVRLVNISNNKIRSSWNDPTKGTLSYFIDGSGIAGNVYGKIVTGNQVDNMNSTAAYSSFTPDIGVNTNQLMVGTGTTVTAF